MRFLAPAALLILLAFFAASEFALIRLRPTRVQLLEEDGHAGATAVARLQRRLRRALVATQLGMAMALSFDQSYDETRDEGVLEDKGDEEGAAAASPLAGIGCLGNCDGQYVMKLVHSFLDAKKSLL